MLDQITDMMRTIVANQTLVANQGMVEKNVDVNDHRRNVPRGIRLDFPHFDGDNPSWVGVQGKPIL